MNRTFVAATLVVASAWARAASADTPDISRTADPRAPDCATPLDADAVVRCALAASPEVRVARAQLEAAAGRRATAEILLPNNPTIAGTVSNRRRPPPETASVLNWSVIVSQELQVGGQRAARIDEAEAAAGAAARRAKVADQEVAAGALAAYYEALAAQESLRFATQLAATAETLAAYAAARAKEALVAGVEADVARAEGARIGLVRIEAERRLTDARGALAVLLDVDPRRLRLPDALPQAQPPALPPGSLEEQALNLRGEVAAAEMERLVLERRLAVVRRERVPNPTISAFFERGEINDRIIGVGLSVPLPLPAPVGRTRAGEIAETLAQIRAAESSQDLVRRRVRLEVTRALAASQSRNAAGKLFPADLLARAQADLAALREAIASRQLTLREGLQWQRSLIELLQADIEVRLARALAWVDLRRVVGLPLLSAAGGAR
ncbi:MAG TPA: TolC family protein [Gemmatimonadaceae bacterium]|nr:TolC family protein [Gemmatimonadaceae bacterium]